ncbi:permease [Spiribacter halobius]|uniref:Permease n=1 Tax=Sediminicurvatus halobius TaxID=2182432 RepID=A0A2U2MVP7_9GAMM|nr:permease [Spiribacter halobius]PWG60914.1 permease [Spiribacter halobius]UEX76759.1 permease [Spiribacter halobius]
MRLYTLLTAPQTPVWLLNATLLAAAELALEPKFLLPVVEGLAELLPVIAIAALLAGTLSLGDIASRVRRFIGGGTLRAVVIGSTAGAVTPVCGLGVVPLIAALQRQQVALPAIMAFWVSSPITDPAMLVMTAGVLGTPFAVAKTLAAFAMGALAGVIVALLHPAAPAAPEAEPTSCTATADARARWAAFARESLRNGELALRWITLALILEIGIRAWAPEQWISFAVGGDHWWSVPLAATVAAPLYLDGYAALPLVRGLAEVGMSAGAALALLLSGAVVSLYAAVAVFSVVPLRLFVLYLFTGMAGAILCGYVAALVGLTIVH